MTTKGSEPEAKRRARTFRALDRRSDQSRHIDRIPRRGPQIRERRRKSTQVQRRHTEANRTPREQLHHPSPQVHKNPDHTPNETGTRRVRDTTPRIHHPTRQNTAPETPTQRHNQAQHTNKPQTQVFLSPPSSQHSRERQTRECSGAYAPTPPPLYNRHRSFQSQ